ncbi:MAG TPA: NAD(P)-dependent oxidoreductase [Acidimicrobiales bacterium]|nr:NAD(P)-dependent oxidoreductase [Acidimicrobiales bacterium]
MERLRVLATAPLRGPGRDRLAEIADVVEDPWLAHEPIRLYDAGGLAERIAAEKADVVICEADRCAGPVLDLPLVAIGATRGNPDNVDLAGATAHGIPVLHAPGRNANGVAELTVALLLAATRRIVPADRDVRAGEVYKGGSLPYQRFRAWELAGRTAGLVGLGAVGRAVKWRLEGLGLRVISADPYAPDATHDLDDLVAEADIVSVHAVVTPDTLGLISAERIARMRPGAVFLNTARAALHDLDALTAALVEGRLGAAGLDHFTGEVLATDHPLVALDNVVLTPHIGGATYDAETNHTALIADGLARLVRGERPEHMLNPEVLA